MVRRLLVAGSNSGYQLGVGHEHDVRSFQEARCQVEGQQDSTSFPPEGFTIVEISSGANHTLALLESIQNGRSKAQGCVRREIWVCGTGREGQLGPAHASPGSKPTRVFTRLDIQAHLSCVTETWTSDSTQALQPERVVCGWNCSYVVLTFHGGESSGDSASVKQDVLISLGLHRDNTFGELGTAAPSSLGAAAACVHAISFAGALADAGLEEDAPFRIVDVAAGLRHAVAALRMESSIDGEARTIVAGWGSARQGQVGRVPKMAARQPGPSRRPGPAAVVVSQPQLIFNSKTEVRCQVRAGKEHTVVLMQGLDGEGGSVVHCIGSTKQGQIVDTSALSAYATSSDDIADLTCNWTTTHLVLSQVHTSATRPLILSCGSNARGQKGNGGATSTSVDNELTPVDLTFVLRDQSSPSAEAHDAPSTSPSLGSGLKAMKLVSGSEHSLLLIDREIIALNDSHRSCQRQVWGWGWNEHGNLAQGEDDEADRDRPVLLLDGTRSGAAQPIYTPSDIWAGCGTTFILADRHGNP
ncbi:uncharacterized protein MEPE_04195 [Melanopsichium pennsylvanicum]|uniref:Uncharacterized protein n=2 Tax=Melanopsichium pennsylvanicum TaxID=63383 RepID=A0AAJ5C669_9BASI|nr:conserved hypothetical protein [Melanopsichium pennsylvanicum 4]SNX85486.1 uncharacterized protein MEPE_04195 [Melanopsichium pennsylvanicum]